MAVSLFFDPVRLVLEVSECLWPEMECTVQYVSGLHDGEDAYGATDFPDDGSTPRIQIDTCTPIEAAVEILAHELAHVAAGPDAEHGEDWERAFDAIFLMYHKRVQELAA
jgi:hypothetical protein